MWKWLQRQWWNLRDAIVQDVCNHPTVVHEWEWTPVTDDWRPRQEWTCSVCGKDFLVAPLSAEQKRTSPPERAEELTRIARQLWTEQQAESVRVRGFEGVD